MVEVGAVGGGDALDVGATVDDDDRAHHQVNEAEDEAGVHPAPLRLALDQRHGVASKRDERPAPHSASMVNAASRPV